MSAYTHGAFQGFSGEGAWSIKVGSRVDDIALYRLADYHLSRAQEFDTFFQKFLPEGSILLDPCLNRFSEISRERNGHCPSPRYGFLINGGWNYEIAPGPHSPTRLLFVNTASRS